MADLPITFSGPMVKALLREIEQPGTGKTQTRRVINPQPTVNSAGLLVWKTPRQSSQTTPERLAMWMRYRPGDRLYVREHWRAEEDFDAVAPRGMFPDTPIAYEASPSVAHMKMGSFRQAMHMPKWASRITLLVTDVRVERLQDCSIGDAIAEGIEGNEFEGWRDYSDGPKPCDFVVDPRRSYATLWDSINGAGAWAKNPWVVAYSFRPILGHINQVAL